MSTIAPGRRRFRASSAFPIEGPHEDERFWIDQLPDQTRRFGFGHAEAFEPDRWLDNGDTVTFGGETLEVYHCPGHTPGHVVFFSRANQLAIVGDVLFAGSIGRTDFPRGNHADLIRSIRTRLWPLGDDVDFRARPRRCPPSARNAATIPTWPIILIDAA